MYIYHNGHQYTIDHQTLLDRPLSGVDDWPWSGWALGRRRREPNEKWTFTTWDGREGSAERYAARGRAKNDGQESVTHLKSMIDSGGCRTATRPCRRRGWSRDRRAHRISGGDSGERRTIIDSEKISADPRRRLTAAVAHGLLNGFDGPRRAVGLGVAGRYKAVAVGVPSAGERAGFRWRSQCPVHGHWRLSKPFCTIIISRTGSGHRAERKNNKNKKKI